jgi:hypothetical protein
MILVSVLTILVGTLLGYLVSTKVCNSVYSSPGFLPNLSDSALVAVLALSSTSLVIIGLFLVIIFGTVGLSILGFGAGGMLPLFPVNKTRNHAI